MQILYRKFNQPKDYFADCFLVAPTTFQHVPRSFLEQNLLFEEAAGKYRPIPVINKWLAFNFPLVTRLPYSYHRLHSKPTNHERRLFHWNWQPQISTRSNHWLRWLPGNQDNYVILEQPLSLMGGKCWKCAFNPIYLWDKEAFNRDERLAWTQFPFILKWLWVFFVMKLLPRSVIVLEQMNQTGLSDNQFQTSTSLISGLNVFENRRSFIH